VAAARSGLSAAGYGHARHRAAEVGAALLLLVAFIAGWRLAQAPSSGAPEETSPPSGSSVTSSRVDIGDAGEVHVVMDLHFAAAVYQLIMYVPTDAGAGGAFQPAVALLGLDVDGSRVELEETLGAGESVYVPLASAADQIRLEYDATGTFVASTPSKPGRGLVLLTPLIVVELTPLTVVKGDTLAMLEVVDARVLNLGCASAEELTACGSRSGSRWIASPTAEAAQVIAQIDLERR
jgi:hypothetical protein